MTFTSVHTACALIAGALIIASSPAQATPISASYAVSVNDADPGLVIQTAALAGMPTVHALSLGVPVTFDLFRIWTDETAVNLGEDNIFKPAAVQWTFATLPGVVITSGFTHGSTFFGLFDAGRIYWGSPTVVDFPNGAQLVIELSEVMFNASSWSTIFFDLTPGIDHGTNVQATFLLTRMPQSIDEPSVLTFLFSGALGALAVHLRRTKARS